MKNFKSISIIKIFVFIILLLGFSFYVGEARAETETEIESAPSPSIVSSSVLPLPIPSLRLISPNGGEKWQNGQTQPIRWHLRAPIEFGRGTGFLAYFQISLLNQIYCIKAPCNPIKVRDLGRIDYIPQDEIDSDWRWPWLIQDIKPGSNYLIKVSLIVEKNGGKTVYTQDISDGVFAIVVSSEESKKAMPLPIPLPAETSIKITPREAKPISLEGKTENLEKEEIEKVPRVSVKVKPVILPEMPEAIAIRICHISLKEKVNECLAAGKEMAECQREYETKVKEECVAELLPKMAEKIERAEIPPISINVEVDKEKKLTKIKEGGIVAVTQEALKVKENQLKIETPKAEISVNVLPSIATEIAVSKISQEVKKVELKAAGEKAMYEIEGVKRAKILKIFPVQMKISTIVNVISGKVEKIKKPWWSFLAF